MQHVVKLHVWRALRTCMVEMARIIIIAIFIYGIDTCTQAKHELAIPPRAVVSLVAWLD
jgi:hypothetical protein